MIEIPREALGRFRLMMGKSVLAGKARGPCPLVLCEAGKRGLALSCEQDGVGLSLHLVGRHATSAVCLPGKLLADLEGSAGESVRVEQQGPMKGRATWTESSGERVLEFDTAEPRSLNSRAAVVAATTDPGAGFLSALAEASKTASRKAHRSVDRVLLRGEGGYVVGTDGRQLLVHSGFSLPWKDDVLVPALPAFTSRELSSQGGVRLGRSGEHVAVECGAWALTLKVDQPSRYPDYTKVLPSREQLGTRLRLHPADVDLLLRELAKLPCPRGDRCVVTLDLSATAAVRPHEEGAEAMPLARIIHTRRQE